MALWSRADSKTQWYGGRYPGVAITPRVAVLHCTEGTGWPVYQDGAVAPHFTARADFSARRLDFRQHFTTTRNARALRNPAGGVETNTAGAVQIEIVGTCDRRASFRAETLRMWELPAWAVRDLGVWVAWLHAEHDIPFVSADRWPAYPNDDSARFTGREWLDFDGVCGHLHVPENDHQDPGDIPVGEILEAARGGNVEAKDVWKCDIIPNNNPDGTPVNPDNPLVQAQYAAGLTLKHSRGARLNTDEIIATLARVEKTLDEIMRQLGTVTPAGIEAAGDALVERLGRVRLVAE